MWADAGFLCTDAAKGSSEYIYCYKNIPTFKSDVSRRFRRGF